MRRTYRGRTETLVAVLSLLVVISMILGMLLSALPERESSVQLTPTATQALVTPTLVEPTLAPTSTPVLQPTPLPQPTS